MDRKAFIKQSCGACMAIGTGMLLGGLLDSCKAPLGVVKTTSKNDEVEIPLTEFAQSDFKLVRVAGFTYDLAVQKKENGTFEALMLVCTHAGHPLTKAGKNYYCTLHGSRFDHEGHVLTGPAEKDLPRLPVAITKDHLSITLKQI